MRNWNNEIVAVPVTGCNNEVVVRKLKGVENHCLGGNIGASLPSILNQLEQSLKQPFEVLARSESSTSYFIEWLTQLQIQSNEKASKSFKKIPFKYQIMMLVAISVSEVTQLEYKSDASEFFKCTNTVNAQVMLNSLLEEEGIDYSVSSEQQQYYYMGDFCGKIIVPIWFCSFSNII